MQWHFHRTTSSLPLHQTTRQSGSGIPGQEPRAARSKAIQGASASHDETVMLWSIKTKEMIQKLDTDGMVSELSFTSDLSHLVTDRGMLELGFLTQMKSPPSPYVNNHWVTCKKEI